ncbi:hypothetical protein ACYZTM_29325 [Pseudomonas sp. MDT2-39-1]
MKTRTQLIILGLVVVGLSEFLKPIDALVPLQTRLRGQSVEVLNQSRSLASLVECINQVDEPWRRSFWAYQARDATSQASLLELQRRYPALFNPRYGDDLSRDSDGHKLRLAPCLPQAKARLALHEHLPEEERAALYYAEALNAMDQQVIRLDFEHSLFIRNNWKPTNIKDTFLPAAERLTDASDKLRPVVEQKDRELRTVQLTQLYERFGKDAHWHVLRFMLEVRDTFSEVKDLADRQVLDSATLAAAHERMDVQLEQMRTYLAANPSTRSTYNVHRLWQSADPFTVAWLKSMQTLVDDWNRHAPPRQLSDDFDSLTLGYDRLMEEYNRWAGITF